MHKIATRAFGLLLLGGALDTGTASAQTTFTNPSPITIPGAGTSGPGTPYPSPVAVVGLSGTITKLTITLNDLNHTFPDDIDALLVAPDGTTNLLFMSDAGGANDAVNSTLVFDDAAAAPIFDTTPEGTIPGNTTTTYQPFNYVAGDAFAAPAPAPSAATALSVFNGLNPNGVWNLYIVDDVGSDVGQVAGGYSLTITTPDAPLPVELSSFTGSASAGGIALSWTTATERDNAGFTVLRNGVEVASFRGTAALRGHGTTGQTSRYAFTDTRVQPGQSYVYTLTSTDISGELHRYERTVEVAVPVSAAPTAFALSAASPNPFNPTTRLMLSLPENAQVTATLYNALGQPVRVLSTGTMSAGVSPLTISADGLATGAYLVRVVAVGPAGTHTSSQRITLVK